VPAVSPPGGVCVCVFVHLGGRGRSIYVFEWPATFAMFGLGV
jgi:hypothetical protein